MSSTVVPTVVLARVNARIRELLKKLEEETSIAEDTLARASCPDEVSPRVSDTALVLEALRDPRYTWRTIDGISSDTDLPSDRILAVLSAEKDVILRSSLPDRDGRALYTTIDHYKAHSGILSKVLSALSDQVR